MSHIDFLRLCLVFIDAYYHFFSWIDHRLASGRSFLYPVFRHSTFYSFGHASELLDLLDNFLGLSCQIFSQSFHQIGPAPGVSDVCDFSFLLDNELGVASDARRVFSGKRDGLIEGIRVQTLSAAKHCRQGLDRRPHNIIMRVLLGKRPARSLAMRSQQ